MHYVETVYRGKSISEDEIWTNSELICTDIFLFVFYGCLYPLSMYEGPRF